MKGILEFSLPEERPEFEDAQQGSAWKGFVFEFDQHLRGIVKHGEDETQRKYATEFRDQLYKMLEDHDLRLN